MPILYNLRRTADGYIIAKFDEDFNVAGVYTLSPQGRGLACDCPAGPRPSCKHRKMVPIFAAAGRIDTSAFYCYETQQWHQPIPAGPWDADSPTADRAMAESERTIPTKPPAQGEAAGPAGAMTPAPASPPPSIRRI